MQTLDPGERPRGPLLPPWRMLPQPVPARPCALHDWAGRQRPVVALVDDTVETVTVARWAARAARHRSCDVALLHLARLGDGPPQELDDEAWAVAGRALPRWMRVTAAILAVVCLVPVTSWVAALLIPLWLGAAAAARP